MKQWNCARRCKSRLIYEFWKYGCHKFKSRDKMRQCPWFRHISEIINSSSLVADRSHYWPLCNLISRNRKLTLKNGSWWFKNCIDFWRLTLLLWISGHSGIVLFWTLIQTCFHLPRREVWGFVMQCSAAIIIMRLGIEVFLDHYVLLSLRLLLL